MKIYLTAALLLLSACRSGEPPLVKHELSLPEAVALAEKHHPGSKANQAELKFKKERLYYEVEVVTPKNEVFDVKVDAKDGTVFQSKPDNHD